MHHDKPFHDGTFRAFYADWDPSHPYRYDDGVTITVSALDMAPDDNFLG